MACLPATLRVVLFVSVFLTGCLHICVLAFPNWWWFDYGYWVQDTTGVLGTNGGLFQYCQHYRLRLFEGNYACYNYGTSAGGDLDTTPDLMPLGGAWRGAQACAVLSLLISLPVVVLIGAACKVVRKRLMMRIASLLVLCQSFLMIAALGCSHQWIITPLCFDCERRNRYNYDWAFYCAGALIAMYIGLALLSCWVSCIDTDEPEKLQGRAMQMPTKKKGAHAEDI